MKIKKYKIKEYKIAVYSAGFMIVMIAWLAICAGDLSVHSLLKTAMLLVLSYIAMVFDIDTKRIPNTIVLIMITGWMLLLLPLIVFDTDSGIRQLTDSIFGLLAGGGLFLLVYIISRKGLGGGDVKFMAAVGLYLGLTETVPAILYGTVLAALTGAVLILLKKIGRKDTMPLAPFLFIGIIITVFTH